MSKCCNVINNASIQINTDIGAKIKRDASEDDRERYANPNATNHSTSITKILSIISIVIS